MSVLSAAVSPEMIQDLVLCILGICATAYLHWMLYFHTGVKRPRDATAAAALELSAPLQETAVQRPSIPAVWHPRSRQKKTGTLPISTAG